MTGCGSAPAAAIEDEVMFFARQTNEPPDPERYTTRFERFYTWFAEPYNWLVHTMPVWRVWIGSALPYLRGSRVLEVSFGTGYLLTQYAAQFEAYGLDYNRHMAQLAAPNLTERNCIARLAVGNVAHLPYDSGAFDTVLNTMAFSGCPAAQPALTEMLRVFAPEGHLVMVDINWAADGDILRDMKTLFRQHGLVVADHEIGRWGSVHLYIAYRLPSHGED
jgi:ubiquinone/menaquinone biosynthesis C-methylase UbiE